MTPAVAKRNSPNRSEVRAVYPSWRASIAAAARRAGPPKPARRRARPAPRRKARRPFTRTSRATGFRRPRRGGPARRRPTRADPPPSPTGGQPDTGEDQDDPEHLSRADCLADEEGRERDADEGLEVHEDRGHRRADVSHTAIVPDVREGPHDALEEDDRPRRPRSPARRRGS